MRINRHPNPNASSTLYGYQAANGAALSIVPAANAPGLTGGTALEVDLPTLTGQAGVILMVDSKAKAGQPITLSAWVQSSVPVYLNVQGIGVAPSPVSASHSGSGNWERLSLTTIVKTSGTAIYYALVKNPVSGQGFLIDGVLIEEASRVGTYFDGDSGFPIRWLGDPGKSMSMVPDDVDDTTATPAAKLLYKAMPPLAVEADPDNDWALLRFTQAITTMLLDRVYSYVLPDDGSPAWSLMLDVDRAPSDALGYIAMFSGATLKAGLTDDGQRIRIKEAQGWQRGKPDAIKGAARSMLTGTKQVTLVERYLNPYRIRLTTLRTETPDPVAMEAAVRAALPAGITLEYGLEDPSVPFLAGWAAQPFGVQAFGI